MNGAGWRRVGLVLAPVLLLAGCGTATSPPAAPTAPEGVAAPATPAAGPGLAAPAATRATVAPVMVSDAPTSTPAAAPVATVSNAPAGVGGVQPAGEAVVAGTAATAAAAAATDAGFGGGVRAAATAVGLDVTTALSFSRPAPPPDPGTGMSQLIDGGSNGRPEVALTFDTGADRGYAEAILDLLRDQGIPATFGMTGRWAEANPDLIQRMVAEGHQLINHTWSHPSLTGVSSGLPPMTYAQLADELARTEHVVRDLTGYELRPYFRPPYGDYDATTLGWLAELGYPFSIMWTCDSQGWRGWTVDQVLAQCAQVTREDEVILMHVGADAAGDYEALPLLIDYFWQQGYAFVTVEQMLQP